MIRLVVADDHPIVRAGLHRIVADCPDMEVVGETDDGNTLLDVLEATDADIVLLDIAMPGLPFLDLLKLLRERWPRLRKHIFRGSICSPSVAGRRSRLLNQAALAG
jgi:DNA-binding NarL/FixJ family response regulator